MKNAPKNDIQLRAASLGPSSPTAGDQAASRTSAVLAQRLSPTTDKYALAAPRSTAAPKSAPVLSPGSGTSDLPLGSVGGRFTHQPSCSRGQSDPPLDLAKREKTRKKEAIFALSPGIRSPQQAFPSSSRPGSPLSPPDVRKKQQVRPASDKNAPTVWSPGLRITQVVSPTSTERTQLVSPTNARNAQKVYSAIDKPARFLVEGIPPTRQLSPSAGALPSSPRDTRPAQKLPPMQPVGGQSAQVPVLATTQRPSPFSPLHERPPQIASPASTLFSEGLSPTQTRSTFSPLRSDVRSGTKWYHYHHHRHGEYHGLINPYHLQMTAYSLVLATVIAAIFILSDIAFPHCEHPVRCFDMAYEMESSMMTDVDPCDNMYQFTCGRWGELYPGHKSQFQLLQERLFITILQNIVRPLDPTSAADKTGLALLACMDVKNSQLELADSVVDILSRYDLSWPTDETRTTEEIFRLLIALSLNDGVGVFFQLKFSPYLRTDDRMVLEMSLGRTMFRYVLSPDVLSECILAYNEDIPDTVDLASSIVGVENDVQASISSHVKNDQHSHYMTYNDLDNIGDPIFNASWWVAAINENLPANVAITGSSEVFMRHTHAFKLVNDILKEYKTFSTVILNFIGWKVIKYFSYASSYKMSLCHWTGGPVHWSRTFAETLHFCLQYIKTVAPYALLKLQLMGVITENTMDAANHIARNVRDEIEATFNESWLDAQTSRGAVHRLHTMYQLIGMPKKLIPEGALDDFYSYVPSVTSDNFILWLIDAHRATAAHRKQLLVNRSDERFLVTRDDWEPPSILMNAFYIPVYHMIFIPGNILIPPFFTLGAPVSVDYGSLGRIVAHEITHAFDKDWIGIDNSGDENLFFTEQSRAIFLSKQACLIHQANKLTGSEVAGNNSKSETFADNAALQLVFQAYQKLPRHQQDGKYELIGLTSDQAFFFSSCFLFCSSDSSLSSTGNYLPNELRCNQPLINTDQFAIAFNCRKGRPMTPQERCVFF